MLNVDLVGCASFCPHALKGQKLLAQGIALGNYGRPPLSPCFTLIEQALSVFFNVNYI